MNHRFRLIMFVETWPCAICVFRSLHVRHCFMCRLGCGAGRGRVTRAWVVHRLGTDGEKREGKSLGSPSDARAAGSNGLGMGEGEKVTYYLV